MKVFVVGGAVHYANFLEGHSLVDSVEDAEVVLFTGGEDVTPSLYGCKKHPTSYCNSVRDLSEKEIFNKIRPDQVALGICRGSQFLCVMNGGKLVQDCNGHASGRTHGIIGGDELYHITSTHHQMQYPFNLDDGDYNILFVAEEILGDHHEGDQINRNCILASGEPEIVLYHKEGLPKCLAVQGHPEMIPNSPVAAMISNLVKDLVAKCK